MTRTLLATLAVLLAAAFVLFVWPTRWRYDHVTVDRDTYPVRIDRVTGHADVLLPGDGWTPAEEITDMGPGQDSPEANRNSGS
ncbi:MAG TPA: hypothetical protein VJY35_05630 [Candidatus Eisenbacteria bacterium]|nr:hypothetical protein [Candidatus Eisenbacteria bacterium]